MNWSNQNPNCAHKTTTGNNSGMPTKVRHKPVCAATGVCMGLGILVVEIKKNKNIQAKNDNAKYYAELRI